MQISVENRPAPLPNALQKNLRRCVGRFRVYAFARKTFRKNFAIVIRIVLAVVFGEVAGIVIFFVIAFCRLKTQIAVYFLRAAVVAIVIVFRPSCQSLA